MKIEHFVNQEIDGRMSLKCVSGKIWELRSELNRPRIMGLSVDTDKPSYYISPKNFLKRLIHIDYSVDISFQGVTCCSYLVSWLVSLGSSCLSYKILPQHNSYSARTLIFLSVFAQKYFTLCILPFRICLIAFN
jgi:hypothetical protein